MRYDQVAGQLVVAEGYSQCTNVNHKRCQSVFPTMFHMLRGKEQLVKYCESCRAKRAKYGKRKYNRAANSRYHSTHRDQSNANQRLFFAKRPERKAQKSLHVAIHRRISGKRTNARDEMVNMGWIDAAAIRQHFESTWPKDGIMSWNNFGSTARPGTWQMGHVIAQKHYSSGEENLRRCFAPANLFAQWTKENTSMKTKLPSDSVLLSMQEYWPTNWNGCLPLPEERIEMEKQGNGAVVIG